MDKPKCKLCGERHWGACAKLADLYGKPGFEVAAEALGITEPVFNPVKSGTFDRVAYQREYMRKWRADHPHEPKTTLYRHFNAEGHLLYVGITANPEARGHSHSSRSSWWKDVVRSTLEYFATLPDALAAESAAVATEHPLHNKQLTQQTRAPPGTCPHCDARRAEVAVAVRKHRAKKPPAS